MFSEWRNVELQLGGSCEQKVPSSIPGLDISAVFYGKGVIKWKGVI